MQDPDITLYQLSHYKPLIDRAIKLTEEYVSENKLILTGGMAIDLALRANGQSIYDDDTLPDYDIISDMNLFHANALAEKLCKEGLLDINVINAVHMTTVKVRIKNTVLLDATYIPVLCYKRIPYLDVDHLRIVHPYYQFIDQRLSLSHLMADTGISLNIFNRLIKNVKRNLILRASYPIKPNPTKISTRAVCIPLDMIRVDERYLNQIDSAAFVYAGQSCIFGYVGYVIMMAIFNNEVNNLTATDSHLEVSVPNDIPVCLISCSIDLLKTYIKKPSIYRPLINLKPIAQRCGDYEFVDTYGSRVSCNIVELPNKVKVCVGSVDYLLMEMLRDRVYVNEEPYSTWYFNLVNAVDTMRSDPKSSTVWWPTLNCYGIDDLPEYRVFMLERLMDPDTANGLKPRNSYPTAPKCATRSEFNQETSHYFQIDGSKDNSIKHSSYKYVMQLFQEYLYKKRNAST